MLTKREDIEALKRAKAAALRKQRRVYRVFRAVKRLAETMEPKDRVRLVLEKAVLELGRYHSHLVNDEEAMDIIHRAAFQIKNPKFHVLKEK